MMAPTYEEALALPSFYSIISAPQNQGGCADCRKAQPHRMARREHYACDRHRVDRIVAKSFKMDRGATAAVALAVLRAGGNPEPKYNQHDHPRAYAQWAYKPSGKRAERELRVKALTTFTVEALVTA